MKEQDKRLRYIAGKLKEKAAFEEVKARRESASYLAFRQRVFEVCQTDEDKKALKEALSDRLRSRGLLR